MSQSNLHSSAELIGEVVTQILINNNGQKKTYRDVLTSTIEQGEYTKFMTKRGFMVMVKNDNNWIVEVYPQKSVE
jgi:hypothetical protein